MGFRVYLGVGFRVQGSGFRGHGSVGFRVVWMPLQNSFGYADLSGKFSSFDRGFFGYLLPSSHAADLESNRKSKPETSKLMNEEDEVARSGSLALHTGLRL